MIVRLSLGEVERARLVLRGGSVLDWRRLNVNSREECEAILRVNGFEVLDKEDTAHLKEIQVSAIDYLKRNFGFSFSPEICNACFTSDLMLMASGGNAVLRRQACTILKVMLVIHHIEARELKARLNISDNALYHLLEDKTQQVINDMKDKGYPIIDFKSSQKTHDSIITKLLSKRQGNRALLYDMLRFRIVTANTEEIVPVIAYLSQHLFPFNYTVPGESHNTLFDFTDYVRCHPRMSKMIPELHVDMKFENEMLTTPNPDTSDTFRTVNFIVDLPLRLQDHYLEVWAPGLNLTSRVVHVLAEFQIVDKDSNISNERGESSHARYKARRLLKVKQRLLKGSISWSGDNID